MDASGEGRRSRRARTARPAATCGEDEPEPLKHLRDYSNFLTPRVGLISMDTWAAVGIVVRNMLINWTILVPLMVGVVMLPMVYDLVILTRASRLGPVSSWMPLAARSLGWISGLSALAYVTMWRPSLRRDRRTMLIPWRVAVALMIGALALPLLHDGVSWLLPIAAHTKAVRLLQRAVLGLKSVGLVFLGYALVSLLAYLALSRIPDRVSAEKISGEALSVWRKMSFFRENLLSLWVWCLGPLLLSVFCLTGYWLSNGLNVADFGTAFWFAASFALAWFLSGGSLLLRHRLLELFCLVLSGVLWYWLEWEVRSKFHQFIPHRYYCFAASASLLCFLIAASLFIALTSRWTDDEDREWWGRFGAYLLLTGSGWAALSFVAIGGPDILRWLESENHQYGIWVKGAYALLTGSGVGALLAGHSGKTSADGTSDKPGTLSISITTIASVLGAVFLVFLLGLEARIVQDLTQWNGPDQPGLLSRWLILALAVVVGTVVMPRIIGVNRFSLHAMYRSRLIRGYLGASNEQRGPNPFTGFDRNDNVWMHELRFVPETALEYIDAVVLAISKYKIERQLLPCSADLVDKRASELKQVVRGLAGQRGGIVQHVANMLGPAALTSLRSAALSDDDMIKLLRPLSELGSSGLYSVAAGRILSKPSSADVEGNANLAKLKNRVESLVQLSSDYVKAAASELTDAVGWTRERQAELRRLLARDLDRLVREDPDKLICALEAEPMSSPFTDRRKRAMDLLRDQLRVEVYSGRIARPLQIVNMTLNLVGGKNLGWQERKGESFTVSARHSGSARIGYRDSERFGGDSGFSSRNHDYSVDRGISLGTSIAISGAAASPNMGYISSPVITLLMTLFNLRLGWWLGNPGHAGDDTFYRREPRNGLRAWLSEAFGRTDDNSPYVYLSDGGHFENLGLYEMVRRRCHLIVVCDAAADPDYSFSDLGNAIQKIRVDQGVDIRFSNFPIAKYDHGNSRTKTSKVCALGEINYRAVDGDTVDNGWLIYVKPTLCGDETTDVLNYWRKHMNFPQQSTVNQWFHESEFESYRALGFATMSRMIFDKTRNWTLNSVEELRTRVEDYLKDESAASAKPEP